LKAAYPQVKSATWGFFPIFAHPKALPPTIFEGF